MKYIFKYAVTLYIIYLIVYWVSGCPGNNFDHFLGQEVGKIVNDFKTGYGEVPK